MILFTDILITNYIYYYQLNGAFTALLLRPVSMLILTLYFFRNSNLIQRISFELKLSLTSEHNRCSFSVNPG